MSERPQCGYLLDTNAVIALLNDPAGPISRRLLSRNVREFARVPGLKTEDWGGAEAR